MLNCWPPPITKICTSMCQGWRDAGWELSTSHVGHAGGDGLEAQGTGGRKEPSPPPSPGQEGVKTHVRQPQFQQGLSLGMMFPRGGYGPGPGCRHFLPSLVRRRGLPEVGPISPSRQENEVFSGHHEGLAAGTEPSPWTPTWLLSHLVQGCGPQSAELSSGEHVWLDRWVGRDGVAGHFGISKADT